MFRCSSASSHYSSRVSRIRLLLWKITWPRTPMPTIRSFKSTMSWAEKNRRPSVCGTWKCPNGSCLYWSRWPSFFSRPSLSLPRLSRPRKKHKVAPVKPTVIAGKIGVWCATTTGVDVRIRISGVNLICFANGDEWSIEPVGTIQCVTHWGIYNVYRLHSSRRALISSSWDDRAFF